MTSYEMPKPGRESDALVSNADREMMERHKERQAITESEKPKAPAKVNASGYAGMPREMFSGRHRERECRDCGQTFTQYELSKAMAVWVSRLSPGAQAHWNAAVTENALPLFCVPCERRDLARPTRYVEVPERRSVA